MLVYKSKYIKVNFNTKENQIYCDWISSANIDDNTYKNEISMLTECVKTHKPEKMAFDVANFSYIVIPQMQEWQAGKVLPEWKNAGVKKVAILFCNDFFSQISLEQLFNNNIFESAFLWNKIQLEEWFSTPSLSVRA